MKTITIYEVGDIATVKNPSTNNQVGGTSAIKGVVRAKITASWEDGEIGRRYKGLLFDEPDIELSRKAGTITYKLEDYRHYNEKRYQESLQKMKEYDPSEVYFGEFDIQE